MAGPDRGTRPSNSHCTIPSTSAVRSAGIAAGILLMTPLLYVSLRDGKHREVAQSGGNGHAIGFTEAVAMPLGGHHLA